MQIPIGLSDRAISVSPVRVIQQMRFAFTDADCLPALEWIREGVSASVAAAA